MLYRLTRYAWPLGFLLIAISIFINGTYGRFFGNAAPQSFVQQKADLQRTRDAAVRDEQLGALRQLDEAGGAVTEATTLIAAWDQEIAPLQDSPEGLAIAADSGLTRELGYLFSESRASLSELASWEQRLRDLRTTVNDTVSAGDDQPIDVATLAELRRINEQAIAARSEWTRALDGARAIVRTANADQGNGQPATLDGEMQRQLDAETISNLAEERQRQHDIAERRAEAAAEQKRLRDEVLSADNLARLAPFITPRYGRPYLSGAAVRVRKEAEKQPISLTNLRSMGALEPTVDGLKTLARIGTDKDLAEPRWTFPSEPGNWSADVQTLLEEAQRLLREHGELLVEARKLSR